MSDQGITTTRRINGLSLTGHLLMVEASARAAAYRLMSAALHMAYAAMLFAGGGEDVEDEDEGDPIVVVIGGMGGEG